jgi:hypothetical protein
MAKKLSAWNIFVSKVFKEGKAKNKSYQFRDALKHASARKGEMGTSTSTETKSTTKSMTKKRRKGGKGKSKRKHS